MNERIGAVRPVGLVGGWWCCRVRVAGAGSGRVVLSVVRSGVGVLPVGCPVVWWSRLSGGVSGAGVVVEWLSPRRGWGPLVGFPAPCGDGAWSGGLLLSHTLPRAVPSALEGLTSGFGMGPGVSLPPWPPARSLTPDGGAPWVGVSCPCVQNNTVDASTSSHGPTPSSWGGVRGASLSAVWDRSAPRLAALPRPTHQPGGLPGALPARGWGILILKRASRLDAFSGYHFPTWPTSHAPGGTTGTPEVGPSRSSRTEDSPSQDSYARSG